MQDTNHDYDGFLRRLRYTPLVDTLRGRVTGSLDREAIVARAGIPTELGHLIEEIVRSTRLHREEKSEVARDLAEHFCDGIERGESISQLRDDFGDPAAAAVLIRRSMMRKRTWVGRNARLVARCSLGSLLAFVCLYLVVAVRDWGQRPNIVVDHIAALNAPIAAIPVSERAWPLMREGLVSARGLVEPSPDLEPGASESRARVLAALLGQAQDALPGWHGSGEAWLQSEPRFSPEAIDEFFSGNDEGRTKLLEAATRENLGFEITSDGPSDPLEREFLGLEPLVMGERGATPTQVDPLTGSIVSLGLPHLGSVRSAARLLDADARYALLDGDATRAIEDFEAMLEFGRMVREPSLLINQLVGAAIDQLVYQSLLDGLAMTPEAFTDGDLRSVVAMLEGLDEARFIVDLKCERLFFEDIAQRIYTDDGDGDGRITFHGAQAVTGIGSPGASGGPAVLQFLAGPIVSRAMLSRAEALELWNELFDAFTVAAKANAWEIDRWSISNVGGLHVASLADSPISSIRHFPLTLLVPAIDSAILTGHAGRADRDLVIGVANIEAARRRLGAWPASLEEAELDRLPLDPMDGRNLAFGLVGGRPTFWSIGPDRDDDGGAEIITRRGADTWDRRRNEGGFGGMKGYWGIDGSPVDQYDGDVVVWQGSASSISPRGVGEGED